MFVLYYVDDCVYWYTSEHYRPRNTDKEIQVGGTVTSQYSPYQLKYSGNGAIVTDECDHECHARATEDANICFNRTNKVKEKILLLELRE